MFNLKSHSTIDDVELLRLEMKAFNIIGSSDGYHVKIGDETVVVPISECPPAIDKGIVELKEHLFECWQDLATIATRIAERRGRNSGSLDNILFLNSAKKSYHLSALFSDLKDISDVLRKVLDLDIEVIDDHLIKHFNSEYYRVRSLHRLIINEIYRKKLVERFLTMTKQAQISGPWANLDLPMKERMWSWDEEEEEYFGDRERARKSQIRYNPENATSSGFYYVWQDLTRDPYLFTDIKKDSPYKSRHSLLAA